jgi:hypothetical protein
VKAHCLKRQLLLSPLTMVSHMSTCWPGTSKFIFNHLLWCSPLSHHHFCIAKIRRAVLPVFLIPLVKMLYLVIGTTLQDRILIAQKLTELLILTDCQFGCGSHLLYLAGIQPPRRRLNLLFHHRTLNRACTSTGGAFFNHWIINIHCLERSHKTKKN